MLNSLCTSGTQDFKSQPVLATLSLDNLTADLSEADPGLVVEKRVLAGGPPNPRGTHCWLEREQLQCKRRAVLIDGDSQRVLAAAG